MARVSGVEILDHKRGEVALLRIYGVGRSVAKKILKEARVDPNKRVKDWSEKEINAVRSCLAGDSYKIEGSLRGEVQLSIKRLLDIGCYRGLRHRRGLTVRGQKTKNNCRTRKGRRKTVPNKKKATK
ncbi:MAG: 30S ribosomal protein S13 [Cytophagales bacterium]|nr:30S ribosomal protein S13 [Cytophagales bacterium]